MSKIGLYGGSFDPIHNGHIHLAEKLMEANGLDEVWFIPARLNPHKSTTYAETEDRLEMVRIATGINKKFKIYSGELYGEERSYTIDTVRKIVSTNPNDEFYLLGGMDSAKSFHKWSCPHEIANLVKLCFGSRPGSKFTPSGDKELDAKISEGICEIPVMDVSSTGIREKLKKGEDCPELNQKVVEYISQKHLYSYPNH